MATTLSPRNKRQDETVPRPLLIAAAALVGLALAITIGARLAGMTPLGQPGPRVAEVRVPLVLAPAEGGVRVTAPDGTLLLQTKATEAGFLQSLQKALTHARRTHRADPALPVELVRWQGGGLTLSDPATGWRVELSNFGTADVALLGRLAAN